MNFASCPEQGLITKDVVLHRVRIFRVFLSYTGSGFSTHGGSPIPKHGSSTLRGLPYVVHDYTYASAVSMCCTLNKVDNVIQLLLFLL